MASTFPSFPLFQAQDPLSARSQPLAWAATGPGHSILEASAKASYQKILCLDTDAQVPVS